MRTDNLEPKWGILDGRFLEIFAAITWQNMRSGSKQRAENVTALEYYNMYNIHLDIFLVYIRATSTLKLVLIKVFKRKTYINHKSFCNWILLERDYKKHINYYPITANLTGRLIFLGVHARLLVVHKYGLNCASVAP